MNRKNHFKINAILSGITFITLYSYFWYSAGKYSFGISFKNNFIWLIVFLTLTIISIVASSNEYLERKHSIIFTTLYGLPVIVAIILVSLSGGELLESAVGFAYTTFVLMILILINYLISIFVAD